MKPRGLSQPAAPLDDRRADAGCHVRGMFLAALTEPGLTSAVGTKWTSASAIADVRF